MHTKPMPESAGDMGPEKKSDRPCPQCKGGDVTYRVWESSCGGYEDFKYTCAGCKHTWWVEGIDS